MNCTQAFVKYFQDSEINEMIYTLIIYVKTKKTNYWRCYPKTHIYYSDTCPKYWSFDHLL